VLTRPDRLPLIIPQIRSIARPREQHRRLVALELLLGARGEQPLLHAGAHQRSDPVVAQTTGVDRRRDEGMSSNGSRIFGSRTGFVLSATGAWSTPT
jgi:hypothetical protein